MVEVISLCCFPSADCHIFFLCSRTKKINLENFFKKIFYSCNVDEKKTQKITSLILLSALFCSGFGEVVLLFSFLSLTSVCLFKATGCLSEGTDCLSLVALKPLVSLVLLSSEELAVAVDAALTSAAIDMGGRDAFFWSFLKKRLPDEILFSSLSLSSLRVNRPSLLEALNYKEIL